MEEQLQNELKELKNLQESGNQLDDAQTSRFNLLSKLDETEQTAEKTKKDLDSALAQKEHFRTKAEAAEKGGASATSNINVADILALKDVHPDDIKEVEDYAKFKGISIKEAMEAGVIKTTLAERAEQRRTAQAAITRTTRANSSAKQTADDVLNQARQDVDNLPDPEALAEAAAEKRLSKLTRKR